MTYNRICNYCGEKYYACSNCISSNSWKNFCCSRECYKEWVKRQEEFLPKEIKRGDIMAKILLRAGFTNGETISITGYDLELGKFDCTDGKTHDFEDFEYFIVPVDEMKSISERLGNKIEKNAEILNKATKTYSKNDNESNSSTSKSVEK